MISELCEDIDGDENIEIKQETDDSTESGDLSLESAHEAESIELCNEVTSSEVSVATHSYLHTQHIDPSLNFVDCGEEIKKEIKEESLEVNETSEIDSLMIYSCDQCNKSFKEKQLLDVHKWIH